MFVHSLEKEVGLKLFVPAYMLDGSPVRAYVMCATRVCGFSQHAQARERNIRKTLLSVLKTLTYESLLVRVTATHVLPVFFNFNSRTGLHC